MSAKTTQLPFSAKELSSEAPKAESCTIMPTPRSLPPIKSPSEREREYLHPQEEVETLIHADR